MAASPAMVVLEAAVAFMAALSSFFACSTLPCRTTAASDHGPSIITCWSVSCTDIQKSSGAQQEPQTLLGKHMCHS